MTYTRTARPTRPASAGQVEWIEKKTAEHGITYADMAQRTGHAFEDLTTRTAGTWLDILFGLPPVVREGAATEPGLYVHDDALYSLVRTQDGLRLYVKTWDEDARKFVYDRDGIKAADLTDAERVTDEDSLRNYGYVPPKAKAARPARRTAAWQPPVWHGCMDHNTNHCQTCRTCDCHSRDETPMAYNGRVFGPPPGFADHRDYPSDAALDAAGITPEFKTGENTHDDADLLAHFGIV